MRESNAARCCADNALEALPESLGQCADLVKLQASFNKLKTLPASIGGLSKLELLRVACNCLEKVPLPSDALGFKAFALQLKPSE